RPEVPETDRFSVITHPFGVYEVQLRYGFVEQPQVDRDLVAGLRLDGAKLDPETTIYFLGRERIEYADRPGMASWRDRLFAIMSRNASDPSAYFGLPHDRSIDIGTHVAI
ncbi:MAG: potassium transporter Kup, partial [Acidimicrobiales bacterium]